MGKKSKFKYLDSIPDNVLYCPDASEVFETISENVQESRVACAFTRIPIKDNIVNIRDIGYESKSLPRGSNIHDGESEAVLMCCEDIEKHGYGDRALIAMDSNKVFDAIQSYSDYQKGIGKKPKYLRDNESRFAKNITKIKTMLDLFPSTNTLCIPSHKRIEQQLDNQKGRVLADQNLMEQIHRGNGLSDKISRKCAIRILAGR